MATMKSSQSVRYGPGSIYATHGSVSAGEFVTYLWREEDSAGTMWAHIEYDVSSGKQHKRGYVPLDTLNSPGSTTFTPTYSTRYVNRICWGFFGPTYIGYQEAEVLTRGTSIRYTGKKIGDYALVETTASSGRKRFYVNAYNLSVSPIAAGSNEGTKILDLPYNYQQGDSRWQSLNPNFDDSGCAVFCAANVASCWEFEASDPSVMFDRGVFTRTSMECQWYNASPLCEYSGLQVYDGDAASIIEIVRTHINSELPILVFFREGSTRGMHWVTAYGYRNGGLTADNILVKDSLTTVESTLADVAAGRSWRGVNRIFRTLE